MRIILDGRTLMVDKPRGTGKAFTEVYRRLARLHNEWEFVVVHRGSGSVANPFGDISNITSRVLNLPSYRVNLWQSLGLPWIGRRYDAQLIHCPANIGPRWSPTPILVTIHDLIPIQPEFRGPAWQKWEKRVSQVARCARLVTTPSEFSRRQLIETFALPEKKVVSIPWAANAHYRPLQGHEERNTICARYQIEPDQPYVLVFGAEDPRKNTQRILDAWSKLTSPDRGNAVLMVVGLQTGYRDQLLASNGRAIARTNVRLCGYVPEDDVPLLMGGAEFLCFPTLYEGFGLPVLDAFACDTPVLTSHNSSIPEVAGEAAMYVDPTSTQAIAGAMATLLRDSSARRQLIEAGREQAQKFSWARCAEQYSEVMQEFAR